MKKDITIKDVAKHAGVSLSTVSFVINNTKGQTIPESTRIKVMKTIEELNYKPNFMARKMRNKQSNSIGVVTAYNLKHFYFLEMIEGILEAAEANGCSVTLCNKTATSGGIPSFVQYFQENRIDGVLFISSAHSGDVTHETNYIETFKQHDIPYVIIYGATSDKDTSYVNIDFYQNSYDACRHLYERGCRNPLYIAPMDKFNVDRHLPQTERDRISGFEESLVIIGQKHSDILFLPREFKQNDYPSILQMIRSRPHLDGIVACWATYGMQMLNVTRDLNLRVPEQIRMVALDSLPFLQHTYPGLSSMRLPFFEIAQKGTAILISKLSGKSSETIKLSIPSELKIREST
jgi:DNA-binding LacI/PurR family transcriptional regulator